MVDALVSGASGESRAGSSPVLGTKIASDKSYIACNFYFQSVASRGQPTLSNAFNPKFKGLC